MKSATHLQALVKSRSWDKEILLWAGSEKSLHQALGTEKFITLDLLDLFDLSNLPLDDDDTRDQLRDRLRSRLKEIHPGPDNRVILVVRSIGLLARYSIGLTLFYDWFVGSFTLVILLLEGGEETIFRAPSSSLPSLSWPTRSANSVKPYCKPCFFGS